MREAHACVGLLQWAIPKPVEQFPDVLFNTAPAFVARVGRDCLYLGMQDKLPYGKT